MRDGENELLLNSYIERSILRETIEPSVSSEKYSQRALVSFISI